MNKHGLPRDIPAAVERAVRKRAGFGCVICGNAFYTYEHIVPYIEVDTHDPEKMTLLCATHQLMVTSGSLSKESVRQFAKNPVCLRKGYTFGFFDVNDQHPDIWVGTFHIYRTRTILRAFGVPIFCIDEPEESGAPFRLSALLCDKDGKEMLRIVENEWRAAIGNWDVERTGRTITIRRDLGDIMLRLRTDPPSSLTIERLEMYYQGAKISCREGNNLNITLPNGTCFEAYAAVAEGCEVGIDLMDSQIIVGRGGNIKFGNNVPGASESGLR